MKNVLYYHVYLADDTGSWTSMVLEQFKVIEDAGLFDALDKIRVTCITQDDSRTKNFLSLCATYPVTFEIEVIKNTYSSDHDMMQGLNSERTITENFTYRKIYNDCQNEDVRVCYIHTKGITAPLKLNSSNIQQFKNYYYWRQYLNWGVLENWKACLSALIDHDVAGVNFYEHPSRHFSGNFWWANSSYIRKLPDPATLDWWKDLQSKTTDQWLKHASDRFRDEQWLCYPENVKVYQVHELKQSENPAASFFPRRRYVHEVY